MEGVGRVLLQTSNCSFSKTPVLLLKVVTMYGLVT